MANLVRVKIEETEEGKYLEFFEGEKLLEKIELSEEDYNLIASGEGEKVSDEIKEALTKWNDYSLKQNPVVELTNEGVKRSINPGEVSVMRLSGEVYNQVQYRALQSIVNIQKVQSDKLSVIAGLLIEMLRLKGADAELLRKYTEILVNAERNSVKVPSHRRLGKRGRNQLDFQSLTDIVTRESVLSNKYDVIGSIVGLIQKELAKDTSES